MNVNNEMPMNRIALRLHSSDNVAIVKRDLIKEIDILLDDSQFSDHIYLCDSIPAGHKIAIQEIAEGEPILGMEM